MNNQDSQVSISEKLQDVENGLQNTLVTSKPKTFGSNIMLWRRVWAVDDEMEGNQQPNSDIFMGSFHTSAKLYITLFFWLIGVTNVQCDGLKYTKWFLYSQKTTMKPCIQFLSCPEGFKEPPPPISFTWPDHCEQVTSDLWQGERTGWPQVCGYTSSWLTAPVCH